MYRRMKMPGECIKVLFSCSKIAFNIAVGCLLTLTSAHFNRALMLLISRKGITNELRIKKIALRCIWMTSTEDFRCGFVTTEIQYIISGRSRELMTTRMTAGAWYANCVTHSPLIRSRMPTRYWECVLFSNLSSLCSTSVLIVSSCEVIVTGVTRTTMMMNRRMVRKTSRTRWCIFPTCRFVQFTSSGWGARVQANVAEANGGRPKLK
mmetsp:Transcript_56880/g.178150  ORF Transcript_56880/g.178150 Transcript_56880/m.178150 type:complete len:208 (-) Transcript_56880:149-772(-)